jgi:hypothetical protein
MESIAPAARSIQLPTGYPAGPLLLPDITSGWRALQSEVLQCAEVTIAERRAPVPFCESPIHSSY